MRMSSGLLSVQAWSESGVKITRIQMRISLIITIAQSC